MPTHYGHTPGSFNADTIRRLAGPGGAAKATGRTGTPAFGNAAVGRALLNSATSRARQAGGAAARATGRTGTPAFGNPAAGRTLLNSATSQSRQSSSSAGVPWWDQPDRIGKAPERETFAQYSKRVQAERKTQNTFEARQAKLADERVKSMLELGSAHPLVAPNYATLNPRNGLWEARNGYVTNTYSIGPPGTQSFKDATRGGGSRQQSAPEPAPAPEPEPEPEPFRFNTPSFGSGSSGSAPDIPQLGKITPYRSVAPDPGSSATLVRPEAPNVDPLTLPEARQRTVANRSQDLGHLQSARSRSSVRGPRGSFNMADTARRTLLGGL